MEPTTELTITVKVDTRQARQEISDLRAYALQAVEEIKAAYASADPVQAGQGGPKRRV